jgi:hypothetical protein
MDIYAINALPKDAQRWYAMEASDSTSSLPTAATLAGMNMRKTAGFTGLRAPGRGRRNTTNAIWRRGRLKEANVDPRGVDTLQVDIKIGDPLSGVFHQQKREQEEALLAQKAQGSKRRRQSTT